MAGTKRARAVWRSLVTHRFAWMAGVDALLWGLAILSGLALRYEFDVPASAFNPTRESVIAAHFAGKEFKGAKRLFVGTVGPEDSRRGIAQSEHRRRTQ